MVFYSTFLYFAHTATQAYHAAAFTSAEGVLRVGDAGVIRVRLLGGLKICAGDCCWEEGGVWVPDIPGSHAGHGAQILWSGKSVPFCLQCR